VISCPGDSFYIWKHLYIFCLLLVMPAKNLCQCN